jgi:hypothetical protein
MNPHALSHFPRSRIALLLGLGTLAATIAAPSLGCSFSYPLNAPSGVEKAMQDAAVTASPATSLLSHGEFPDAASRTIVGTWRVAFVSDGSAYPGPIPTGAVVDFGSVQWHSDGTEIMVSAGRPPSSGDVCMGVWHQIGPFTYEMKHIAFAYVSSDTPPPIGPASPAVYLGPAIFHEVVTLDHTRNVYSGPFTIDQYAADETTLLEHIGGTVKGTRFAL